MAGETPETLLAENERLTSEVEVLRLRLEEAEQTLEAIRTGQADSLIVEGPDGPRVFSLEGEDRPYRVLVEAMSEGAATIGEDGAIVYCNKRFAEMVGSSVERVMGSAVVRFLPDRSRETYEAMVRDVDGGESRGELELLAQDGEGVPAYLSLSVILVEGGRRLCLVATDLRAQKRHEELVAAEQLARSVIEQAAEAIVVCDEDGRIIRASAAAGRLCGTNPLLRVFDEVFTIDVSARAGRRSNLREFHESSVVEAVFRGGEAHAAPATLWRLDGTQAQLLMSATSLRGEGDRVLGCVINLVDVTDSRRAAEALRVSEERVRFALDGGQQGTWDWDLKTKAPTCDERTTRMFGLPGESAASFQGFFTSVHQDDRQRVTDAVDAAVLERTDFQAEYRVLHADSAPHWLHARSKIFFDADGRPDRMSGTVLDITERKQRELALAEQRRLYKTVTDNATLALFVMDSRQQCVFMNPAAGQLTGFSFEEVRGRSLHGLIHHTHPDGRPYPIEDCPIDRAFPRQNQARGVDVFVHKDGHFYPVAFTASPIVENGMGIGTVIEVRDITEQNRVEGALRDADRRKNEFLAVLSHELRNPLAAIANSLSILDHAPPGGAQAGRATQVIGRQVTHLSNLVNDLLDVTRITHNKVRLRKERLDLNALVGRAVEDHESLFEQAGVRLELLPAARPVPVHADSTRMVQVVGNLLQNAARFTSKGGQTRVSVAVEGGEAVVRVADDGVGMSRETLDRLFLPFSQAEQPLDRRQGGLGLGLALVKGLVELHGGSVSARSDGLGRGVEMIVRLTLDSGAALEAAAPPTHLVCGRRRVLIIEDNVDAADSLGEILAFDGHEVAVAYDGAAGIAKAREFHPDVVLCDIGLPGLDGYDVARAFRSDEALKGIFLVALSGYARPEDLQRAAEAGFQRHLAKPMSFDQLKQILAEMPPIPIDARNSAPPVG